MATNVPQITWVNGAPVLPQESDILAGRFADINNAFGNVLGNGSDTPQGQIAASDTAIIGDKNNQIAFIANQINPTYASGQWQDAIGAIYFIQRIQAAGTVVSCTLIGAVGTIIPFGAQVQDTSGYIYQCISAVQIPASGTITAQFQNLTVGAIPANPNTVTKIFSAISGWDTVNNPAAGSIGRDVESRAAFEQRRINSVANNSVNQNSSILSNILAISGVLDAYVVDNATNATMNVGSTNYPLAAHATLVSVAGGASADIANAIWKKKGAGSPYPASGGAGIQTYTIYDTGYSAPYPGYTITWLQPTSTPVYFKVTIKNFPTLPSNITQLVQNAIIAAFSGSDGGVKASINQTTFSSRYYAGISAINPNVEILSLFMGLVSTAAASSVSQTFGIDQLPVTDASKILVVLQP